MYIGIPPVTLVKRFRWV